MKDYKDMMWRTGGKVGRTIYTMVGPGPSMEDILIGMMDSTDLAEEVVRAHNIYLAHTENSK